MALPAQYFMGESGDMKKGLYRTIEPGLGECAHTHWSAGEGFPFLPRDIYEAAQFQPSFDALPTKEAYEQGHHGKPWRYGSPMWRWEEANS